MAQIQINTHCMVVTTCQYSHIAYIITFFQYLIWKSEHQGLPFPPDHLQAFCRGPVHTPPPFLCGEHCYLQLNAHTHFAEHNKWYRTYTRYYNFNYWSPEQTIICNWGTGYVQDNVQAHMQAYAFRHAVSISVCNTTHVLHATSLSAHAMCCSCDMPTGVAQGGKPLYFLF